MAAYDLVIRWYLLKKAGQARGKRISRPIHVDLGERGMAQPLVPLRDHDVGLPNGFVSSQNREVKEIGFEGHAGL